MAPRSPWANAVRVGDAKSSTAVSLRRGRGVRVIRPVHAIRAPAFGPLDPARGGGDANAEVAGDDAPGPAAPDGGYQGSTPRRPSLCLLMGFSLEGSV